MGYRNYVYISLNNGKKFLKNISAICARDDTRGSVIVTSNVVRITVSICVENQHDVFFKVMQDITMGFFFYLGLIFLMYKNRS